VTEPSRLPVRGPHGRAAATGEGRQHPARSALARPQPRRGCAWSTARTRCSCISTVQRRGRDRDRTAHLPVAWTA